LESIKKELNKIKRKTESLNRILTNYGKFKKDAASNVYKLEEFLHRIKKLANEYTNEYNIHFLRERILHWSEEEEREIDFLKREAKHRFGRELSEALQKVGMELRGQYPNLYANLYHIKVEFERGVASIYWGPEFVKRTKPDPALILEAIEQNERFLEGDDFSHDEFRAKLYDAYRRVVLSRGWEIGARAPIVDVLGEFVFLIQEKRFRYDPKRSNFKEYGRANFGYDLYRLRRSGGADTVTLFVATFDATRSKEKAIFVPDSESGGTRYAYISIRG
jgi:hypothetical protein